MLVEDKQALKKIVQRKINGLYPEVYPEIYPEIYPDAYPDAYDFEYTDPFDDEVVKLKRQVEQMEHGEDASSVALAKEEEEVVQTKPAIQKVEDGTTHASPDLTASINASKGQGDSLADSTVQEMGSKMEADFSNVNIHTDNKAAEMSQSIGAKAFTHGNDIYFNQGNFNPESTSGKHLLAHELTHTVQQGGHSVKPKVQRQIEEKYFGSGFLLNSEELFKILNPIEDYPENEFGSKFLKDEDREDPRSMDLLPLLSDPETRFDEGDYGGGLSLIKEVLKYLYPDMRKIKKLDSSNSYDKKFKESVKYFQEENGMSDKDGVLDGETLRVLDEKLMEMESETYTIHEDSSYKNSICNINIQKALNYLYKDELSIIGGPLKTVAEYTPETKAAIIYFQGSVGTKLTDGTVDSQTLELLDKKLLEKQATDLGPLVEDAAKKATETITFVTTKWSLDNKYWERVGGFVTFQAKVGVDPDIAMDALFSDKSSLECRSNIDVVWLTTIMEYIGREKFNEYFKREKKEDPGLIISASAMRGSAAGMKEFSHPINTEGFEGEIPKAQLRGLEGHIPGDWIGYKSDPRYKSRHPGGAYNNENLIFVAKDKDGIYRFRGLGMRYNDPEAGLSVYDIYLNMRFGYLRNDEWDKAKKDEEFEKAKVEVEALMGGKKPYGNDVPESDPKFKPTGFLWISAQRMAIYKMEDFRKMSVEEIGELRKQREETIKKGKEENK